MPVRSTGSTPCEQQALDAALQGGDLVVVEEFGHLGRHGLCERGDVLEQGIGDGFAGEVPDHGAQFEAAEKHSPWSMPQIRPSSPRSTWPLLRSVLLAT